MTIWWVLVLTLIVATSRLCGFHRAGLWLALAFLGRAAALSLYEAGPVVGYHHYKVQDAGTTALAGAAILLQVALVARGLGPHVAALRAWAGERLPGWRLPVLLLALFAASAKISRPASASAAEFVFATLVDLLALLNLVVAVRELPADVLGRCDAWLDRVLGREKVPGEPEPGGLDRTAWGAALFAFAAAAALGALAYGRHPHVPDEVVYLLHARTFAAGLLSLPVPPVPGGFDLDLMLADGGRWFSPVPPGWPLALAAGAWLGAAWLVNPVLGGLTILALYSLARELTDRRSARWAVLLLAASPWFTFLDMSYMTHPWTLLCAVLAALGVARARRTGNPVPALLGGAAVGMVSLIRPLEGLVLALALGLWSLGFGGARLKLSCLAALVVGTAAVAALVFPYNRHLTGDPLQFPINEYVDRTYGPGKNSMGFGPDKGLGWGGLDPFPGHSPFEAAVNAQFNLFAIEAELFGWGGGSLLLVLFLLLGGKLYRADRALAAFALAIVLANSFYWFSGGPDFGARYWYLVIVPLVLLSVSGLRALEARVAEPARARALVLVLVSFAWLAWVPWRAVDKYHRYRGMDPGIRALAAQHDFGRSLVLVRGRRHPDYDSAAVYNPLDLEADAPIYAWDRSPGVRTELIEHYADRDVWLVVGPASSSTGRWKILDGPVPAARVTTELTTLLHGSAGRFPTHDD